MKKPTPPETFFIVNAERKIDFDTKEADINMMIDSNNIEYVVETLGQTDGIDLAEVCHVLNVPDIVPIPERYRSREIEAFLRDGSYPADFTSNMKCGLRGPAAQYRIIDEELFHEGNKAGSKGLRLVIHDNLPALKVKVMVECHIDEDGSHHGLNKTLNKIGEKYFWIGMSVDVRKFMMHCKICSEVRCKKLYDTKQYDEEAQVVKSRHMQKMNDGSEPGSSDMDLTVVPVDYAVPVSYDSTDIEPTEGLEQEGHQVIRLIGPNKEVTEITVAVVNQETVTADSPDAAQAGEDAETEEKFKIVAKASSGKGQSLVTREVTDAVAQIEAAEAAMEIAELKRHDGKMADMKQYPADELVAVKREVAAQSSEDVNVAEDMGDHYENFDHDNHNEVSEGQEMVEEEEGTSDVPVDTDDGVVNVLIIKEGGDADGDTEELEMTVDDDNERVEQPSAIVIQPLDEVLIQF